MAFRLSTLRTRVGRRMLALFLSCALVPVLVLAAVLYYQANDELARETREDLRGDAKSLGMGVLERVRDLESELELAVREASGRHDAGAAQRAGLGGLEDGIVALVVHDTRGDTMLAFTPERLRALPSLTAAQRRRLDDGLTILSWDTIGGASRLTMRVPVTDASGGSVLAVAMLDSLGSILASLIGAWEGSDRHTCIFEEQRERPLFCTMSDAERRTLAQTMQSLAANSTGSLEWRAGDDEYLAGYWSASLKFAFGAPAWTVVLTEPAAQAFAVNARIFRSVVLLALVTIVAAFLASHVSIRRMLLPLEQLQDATSRIRAGDFEAAVSIRSGDEFEDLAVSFNTMSSEVGHQVELLTATSEIDRSVVTDMDRDRLRAIVLQRFLCANEAIAVTFVTKGSEAGWHSVTRYADGRTPRVETPVLSSSEQHELVSNDQPLRFPANRSVRSYLGALDQGNVVVLPMKEGGDLTGLVALYLAPGQVPQPAALTRARLLADHSAVALSHLKLVGRLEEFNWGTLQTLARTIDANSSWTGGHSERVTRGALMIGRGLGLDADSLDILHRGGLLHDIGKIAVPGTILDKPAKLTPEEEKIVRSHPEHGARILAPIDAYAAVIPIVLHHHEHFDGEGYPHRLRGDAIPFLARITSVSDVYDALTSDRPYRSGWSHDKAVAYIASRGGTQFDPDCVSAFLRIENQIDEVSRSLRAPLDESASLVVTHT